MNWKHVAYLIRVDRKSGRLLRGQRLTKYREHHFFTYLLYGGGVTLGILAGVVAGLIVSSLASFNQALAASISALTTSFFFALPTIVLIYSLVFTMLQQIQRSGIKLSTQVPYWLPITWQEHTLASILANLLGFMLASVLFLSSTILVFSLYVGQFVPALLTSLALFAAAFMASAITEILRVLQVRFIGAVYKSSGRAAVWVRFAGSLLFFVIFYVVYFFLISGAGAITFIQTIALAQNSAWYIPFVWLGIMLSSLTSGLILQGLAFLVLSLLFIAGLFYLATLLNKRFGLYEPPAITVSRGIYTPKTGFLGKLGFSSTEAALIRKDFKAFTRRRELLSIFIVPIVFILMPLVQSLNTQIPGASLYLLVFSFLFPSSLLVMSLGNLMIGQEGQTVWRIYSSPISPKSLVKSKYAFMVIFALVILVVTGTFAAVLYHPSLRATTVAFFEAVFLVFALGAISLSNGIKGADFNEVPRPRMIRMEWGIINLVACLIAALVLLAPFFPYAIALFAAGFISPIDPYIATTISGVIAVVIALIFYRIAVNNADELIKKAQS